MNQTTMNADPVAQINNVVFNTETVAQTLNVSETSIVHIDQEVAAIDATSKSLKADSQSLAIKADELDTANKVYANIADQNYAGAGVAVDENSYSSLVNTGDTATKISIQSRDDANSFATRAVEADTGSSSLELIKNIQIAVAETANKEVQSQEEFVRKTNAVVEQEMKNAQVVVEDASAAQANEPDPSFTSVPDVAKTMMV